MVIEIKDIERLPEAAAQFIENFLPGRVYAFYGSMGAGKTTLIAEICRQLGSFDDTNSPTFSIVNEYETEKCGKIYHFDCYRLEDEEEALEIGAEDYLNSGNTCFVEWPENIEALLPADAIIVRLDVSPDGTRILQFNN